MHHYGARELTVGSRYQVTPQPTNKYDKHAMAITDDGTVKAFLCRKDANALDRVLSFKFHEGELTLRPTEEPEVKSKQQGPRQRCNILVLISKDDWPKMKRVLHSVGFISYELK